MVLKVDSCNVLGCDFPSGGSRLFLLSTSAPCLLAIVLLLGQPESPRWLALNGRMRQAESVLKLLLRRNKKVLATGPIRLIPEVSTDATATDSAGEEQALLPSEQINGAPVYSFRGALTVLGGPEYRPRMILLCCVWFLLSFGFYGFTLWLPSYYKAGGPFETRAPPGSGLTCQHHVGYYLGVASL